MSAALPAVLPVVFPAAVAIALAGLTAAAPLPKPKILQIEGLLASSWLCAEVELLELRGPAGKDPGSVTVRVTTDPGRIARGFDQAGATLEVGLPPGGGRSAAGTLAGLLAAAAPVLFVVDGDRRLVCCGGRADGDGGIGWQMVGFYDFNAVMFTSRDDGVRRECGLAEVWSDKARFTGRLLARQLGAARAAIAGRAVPVLLPAFRAIDRDEFLAAVRALRSGDAAAAARAREQLVEHGLPWLDELDAMRARAGLASTQRAYDEVRAALAPHRAAAAWAAAVRGADAGSARPMAAAAMLLAALPVLAEPLAARARSHLRALAGRLDVDLPAAGGAAELAALRAALRDHVIVDDPY